MGDPFVLTPSGTGKVGRDGGSDPLRVLSYYASLVSVSTQYFLVRSSSILPA